MTEQQVVGKVLAIEHESTLAAVYAMASRPPAAAGRVEDAVEQLRELGRVQRNATLDVDRRQASRASGRWLTISARKCSEGERDD
jgi:hypothetical protein